MAYRVTPHAEEEGIEVEGAKEEGGTTEEAESIVFVHGRFGSS